MRNANAMRRANVARGVVEVERAGRRGGRVAGVRRGVRGGGGGVDAGRDAALLVKALSATSSAARACLGIGGFRNNKGGFAWRTQCTYRDTILFQL